MIELTANKSSFIIMSAVCAILEQPMIFPTDTIYGIGAPIESINANKKVYILKQREQDKPMPILAGNMEQIKTIVEMPKNAELISYMMYLWSAEYPHPCTIVLKSDIDKFYAPDGTLAVRLVKNGWLKEALVKTGPIIATSVNISGQTFLNDIEEIKQNFPCELLLHGSAGGMASHIYDFTNIEALDKIKRIR